MKFTYAFCAAFIALTPVYATGCGILDKGVEKYDTLVDKDEICNQMWADYEAQLQRRSDMIPNLVEVVKAAAGHENTTLRQVIEARASATQIKVSGEDFTDPEKMKKFEDAQQTLKGSLSSSFAKREKSRKDTKEKGAAEKSAKLEKDRSVRNAKKEKSVIDDLEETHGQRLWLFQLLLGVIVEVPLLVEVVDLVVLEEAIRVAEEPVLIGN